MTKRYKDEETLALFCSKCDTCFEDTVGRVRYLQEAETIESDLYREYNFVIDAGWFLMNMVEDSWDFCPRCAEEVNP